MNPIATDSSIFFVGIVALSYFLLFFYLISFVTKCLCWVEISIGSVSLKCLEKHKKNILIGSTCEGTILIIWK